VIPIELSGSPQNPCWSPSGDRLALIRFAEGYNQGKPAVAVASLDGATQVVTPAVPLVVYAHHLLGLDVTPYDVGPGAAESAACAG
jgi:hypothetical protein